VKTRASVYLLVITLLSLGCVSSSVSLFSPSYVFYAQKRPSQAVAIYHLAPNALNTQLDTLSTLQLRRLAELKNINATYQLAMRFLQKGDYSAAQLWWQTRFDSFSRLQQQRLADHLAADQQWQAISMLWRSGQLPNGNAKQSWYLRQSMATANISPQYAEQHQFVLSLNDLKAQPQCHFNVLMMTDHADGIATLKLFKQRYESKPEPSINSFCFSEVVYVANQFQCNSSDNVLQCDWYQAEDYTWPAGFDFIVMMSEQGSANVRGGIMHINSTQPYAVFLHELMHFNGFEDEYTLPTQKQQWLCQQQGHVAPNLFIARQLKPPIGWQKSIACNNNLAYKPSPDWSIMQYQLMGLSEQYRQLWQKQINQPLTKPVRFLDYFAFLGLKPSITMASTKHSFSD